jgi:hypothetical protein
MRYPWGGWGRSPLSREVMASSKLRTVHGFFDSLFLWDLQFKHVFIAYSLFLGDSYFKLVFIPGPSISLDLHFLVGLGNLPPVLGICIQIQADPLTKEKQIEG